MHEPPMNKSGIIDPHLNKSELVERRICPLIELDETKDIPLGRLVRYWFSLPRPHGVLPDIDQIGLMDLTRLGVLGWFHVIGVNDENPLNYRYDVHAMRTIGGHTGIRIGEVGSNALRQALEQDYSLAKLNRFPLFQTIRTDLRSHTREYRRVTLPLASGTDDVTHLLVGVHFDD